MRYMLVNHSTTNINIAVDDPYRSVLANFLQRPGPIFSILLKRGTAYNILPHFKNIVDAHRAITRTRATRDLLRSGRIVLRAFDDLNNLIINVEDLMKDKSNV